MRIKILWLCLLTANTAWATADKEKYCPSASSVEKVYTENQYTFIAYNDEGKYFMHPNSYGKTCNFYDCPVYPNYVIGDEKSQTEYDEQTKELHCYYRVKLIGGVAPGIGRIKLTNQGDY